MTKSQTIKQLEKELKRLREHPAADLLEYFSHTPQYTIALEVFRLTDDAFNDGYKAGRDDQMIEVKRALEEISDPEEEVI